MSQRPKRYRTQRRACMDLSARVDPETGTIGDDAAYRAAVIENDPISLDRLPHPLDWTKQLVFCPLCFNCFARATYQDLLRTRASGHSLRCPMCRQEIESMPNYGTPVITPKERARQEEEIKIYMDFMESVLFRNQQRRPWQTRHSWWEGYAPYYRQGERSAIMRGRKAMTDAYEAGNPGGSDFEARNRRWERYEHDIIAPLKERTRVSSADYQAMWEKREAILKMEELQGEERQDVQNQIEKYAHELWKRHDEEREHYKACREKVDHDIAREGFAGEYEDEDE